MPPVPPVVIFGGGLLVAAGAGYIVYKAYQAATHAHEQEAAKHEEIPQTLTE